MKERRSERRLMCAELVKVIITDQSGVEGEAFANLEDISASGACVQLEAAIESGADLEIVCSKCRLKGKVRYCRFTEIGYDVGVQFNGPGAWDRRSFEPEHLLDVPQPVRNV
jgi:hypothetical protein